MISSVFTKSTQPHVWRETFAYLSAAFWVTLAMWFVLNWPMLWLCRLAGPLKWSWTPIFG